MGDPGGEPRLVVPEGLMIDESARERLERRLAAAPPGISGIGAETSDLPPGTSYRVHAEWTALDQPELAAVADAVTGVRGAVLLRPGIEYEVTDGRVKVADGTAIVIDPGAVVHDPYAEAGTVHDASERGRPPFPRRAVVVFLACDRGSDADWVRRVVNRLVRRDIEARVALPDPGVGLNLTEPCLPTEASIHALAPDVIVTLDPTAAARAHAWCEGNRSTVIVAFDAALRDPMELVSWQIGRAQGRLRARIGPHVDIPAFAALVIRLCAGPQPAPPSDDKILLDSRVAVRESWTNGAAADRAPGLVVLTGRLDADRSARLDGLVDNLSAAGNPATVLAAAGGIPAEARAARLVLLVGVAPGAEIDALLEERGRSDRPTVVDVFDSDLTDGELEPAVVALATACGLVVSPAGALHAAVGELGVRALVLPTLFAREHGAALRDARRPPVDATSQLVIGWRPGDAAAAYVDAVVAGIEQTLEDRRNEVEFVGARTALPSSLASHERVRIVADGPDLDVAARWAVHAWTPQLARGLLASDTRWFEQVSYLGVPSVMPAAAASEIGGFVSPFVQAQLVDAPTEWADALHHVLDDAGRRERRTQEALRRAESLDGPAIAKAIVGRFIGWASYDARRVSA